MHKLLNAVRDLVFGTPPTIEPVQVQGESIQFKCSQSLASGRQKVQLDGARVTVEVQNCKDGVFQGRIISRYARSGAQPRADRLKVHFDVQSESIDDTVTDNINLGGMQITVDQMIPVHDETFYSLYSPDAIANMKVQGVCVWCEPADDGRYRAGIHFPRLLEWQTRWLRRRCSEALSKAKAS